MSKEMEEVKIFENAQFGQIRTSGTSEQPLFCLADICKILDLRTDAVKSRLKDDPILIGVIDSMGREQMATFINEANLYRVIMRSDKPQAEAFQDWVCGEVLPSIRKNGGYMAAREGETEQELLARAVLMAKATIDRQQQQLMGLFELQKGCVSDSYGETHAYTTAKVTGKGLQYFVNFYLKNPKTPKL